MSLCSPTESDHDLLTRTRQGDRLAFGFLYARHHEVAWRMACAAMGFSSDAEIAVVEGFAEALAALPSVVRPDFSFRLHVLRCVRGRVVERLSVTKGARERGSLPPSPPGTVAGLLAGDSGDTVVREALRLLPEEWGTVLWLTAVEGMSPMEISAVVGLEPGRVVAVSSLAWKIVKDACLEAGGQAPSSARRPVVRRLEARRRGTRGPGWARETCHDEPDQGVRRIELGSRRAGHLLSGAAWPPPPLGGDAQRRWLSLGRPIHALRPERATVPATKGPVDRKRIRLDPVASSVSTARRFCERALLDLGAIELLEPVQLLTSELATNAVIHARTPIEVVIDRRQERLRVEVHDRNRGRPVTGVVQPHSEKGRGLLVVERLASEWGVADAGAGKVVWFEVAQPGSGSDAGPVLEAASRAVGAGSRVTSAT